MPTRSAVADVGTAAPTRLAYTPTEAADLLGISRAKLYQYLADGTIGSVKLGRSRRIRREALVAYLDRLEHQGGPDAAA